VIQPGSRLGAYEITSLIGAGGMAEVYRARDTKLGRDIALKILPAKSTIASAAHPFWSRDGRQLYYIPRPGQFASVEITTRPAFAFTNPRPLSRGPSGFVIGGPSNTRQNDSTPDGRVVAIVDTASLTSGARSTNSTPQFVVVTNWFEELKQRVPAK